MERGNTTRYPDIIVSRNIKCLLAIHNMTQSQLANICGCERKTVNHWVNCISEPKATDIKRICKHFNISADVLMGLEN